MCTYGLPALKKNLSHEDHWITEWFGLKRPSKVIWSKPSALGRDNLLKSNHVAQRAQRVSSSTLNTNKFVCRHKQCHHHVGNSTTYYTQKTFWTLSYFLVCTFIYLFLIVSLFSFVAYALLQIKYIFVPYALLQIFEGSLFSWNYRSNMQSELLEVLQDFISPKVKSEEESFLYTSLFYFSIIIGEKHSF